MMQTSQLDLRNKNQLFVVCDKYVSPAETHAETKSERLRNDKPSKRKPKESMRSHTLI